MIDIVPLPAFSDNYIWLINNSHNECIVVDPGCARTVIDYCEQQQLTPVAIFLTHHHHDHTGGVAAIKRTYRCPIYGPSYLNADYISHPLAAGDEIALARFALNFEILYVPGHTLDHIAYFDLASRLLFCGDTLFSAGCGRLFEGTPAQMLHSLQQLAALPNDTLVYCTHEYTASNIAFARQIEPDNAALARYEQEVKQQRCLNQPTLPSSIAQEKQINPFLRCADQAIQASVAHISNNNCTDELSTFTLMRQLKDSF